MGRSQPPLVPDGVTEEAVRAVLRSRGLSPGEEEALTLRLVPVDGRRRKLDEIAAQRGYTRGRASQVLTRALSRVAETHHQRPLPDWLLAALDAKAPTLASLALMPREDQPLSFLHSRGVKVGVLKRSGIRTFKDVLLRSDEELLSVPHLGPRSLQLLRRAVAQHLGQPVRPAPNGSAQPSPRQRARPGRPRSRPATAPSSMIASGGIGAAP